MKKVLFIVSLLFIMVACNKNQSAIKKLDGEWVATKYQLTENNLTVDYIDLFKEVKFQFSNCNLKDNEFCSAVYSVTALDGTINSDTDVYTVKEKGTVLQLGSSSNDYFLIEELSSNKLILTKNDNSGTALLEFKKM